MMKEVLVTFGGAVAAATVTAMATFSSNLPADPALALPFAAFVIVLLAGLVVFALRP